MGRKRTNGTAVKIKASLLVLLGVISTSAFSNFPPDYTATYYVDKLGTTVGRSTISLVQDENEIHYSQHVELVGFISLFKKDRVSENSWITKQNDDTLLFKKYQYVHSNSKKNRDSLIEAAWTTEEDETPIGELTGHSRGKPVSLKINEPIWDTLSFQLALINDVSDKNDSYNYNVISRGQIKQYNFSYIGEETIEIEDKAYKTIKLERHSGNKATKIWLAPSLNYVPVLIEQYKDDDLDSTMTLDLVVFNNTADEDK